MTPLFPDVEVQLVGEDGNVFAIIGRVQKALRRADHGTAAQDFIDLAVSAESYDEVLRLAMQTVTVM